jgi:DNA-binding winged helix-turn-helix (wHTH) protein
MPYKKDRAMTPGEHYRFGPFELDVAERELRRGGEIVPLTAKTLDLLLILMQGAGRTFTKSELLESLWPGTAVKETSLSQTVFLLRKALGENPDGSHYIRTVQRRGYKFVGSVNQEDVAGNGAGSGQVLTTSSCNSYFWPAIATLAVLAMGVLPSVHFRQGAPEARMVRSAILPPEKTSFIPGSMALSPHGRRIVFTTTSENGKGQFWIRPLDAEIAQPLGGTGAAAVLVSRQPLGGLLRGREAEEDRHAGWSTGRLG